MSSTITRLAPRTFRIDLGRLQRSRLRAWLGGAAAPEIDPYLVGQALRRVLELCEARAVNGNPLLWNIFRVFLAADDFQALQPFASRLEDDLSQVLRETIEKRGASLAGPAEVRLLVDEEHDLLPGTCEILADFADRILPKPSVAGEITLSFQALFSGSPTLASTGDESGTGHPEAPKAGLPEETRPEGIRPEDLPPAISTAAAYQAPATTVFAELPYAEAPRPEKLHPEMSRPKMSHPKMAGLEMTRPEVTRPIPDGAVPEDLWEETTSVFVRPGSAVEGHLRLLWLGEVAFIPPGRTAVLGRPQVDPPPGLIPLVGAQQVISSRHLEIVNDGGSALLRRPPSANPVQVGNRLLSAGAALRIEALPVDIALSNGSLMLHLDRAGDA